MTKPVRYSPDVEQIEPDEAQTLAELEEQFRKILDTTSSDYGHAVRAVHAKGHGLVQGRLTIAPDLPQELAQGLFGHSGHYEAIVRFSTNAGDILDDSVRLPRGIALKILNVIGDRLPGSECDTTQDFIMVNSPAFAAPNPKKFLGNIKLLAATADKAEAGKKLLSAVLRGFEATMEAVGTQSTMLTTLGGAKPIHPLGATYFSQTPFRFGDYIAKFSLVPIGDNAAFSDENIHATGRPDAIREDLTAGLLQAEAKWELRVQLCSDLEKMPIEDASIAWDETESPFQTVATLTVPLQSGWNYGSSEEAEDRLSFSPWHGLAAHRPLGGVNRVRQESYRHSAEYRSHFNGCPIHEPAHIGEVEF
ncbi:catalase family protein [Sphingobium sp.]|uniref:catalase family protein n=1 Tax=Sphingobium sp. TaxID=1912891 RepID=UPI002B690698|nr:catalase family protein [Sphingobium sp.]HUD91681.1 catalase family protein [Sphingobium sp.]